MTPASVEHGVSRGAFIRGAAAAGVAIAAVREPASAAQYSWKFGHELSVDHPIHVRVIQATARIREETNGQFEIKVYPDSILGGPTAMISQLRSGAIEMVPASGGILDGMVPVASIENVPFAFPNRQVAFAALDGDLGAVIRTGLQAKGIIAIDRIFENGFRNFTAASKPIRTVDDLQGLRLRVSPGKLRVDTFASLGASPTPISPNELYTSLQTHVVDGQESALLYIESLRLYEVQKYCSLSRHMWAGFWPLVNADKMNALPPNFQEILKKNMVAAVLAERRDVGLLEQSVRDRMSRQGLKFNDVDQSTFRAKLASNGFYGRWRNEWGPAAWAALEKYSGPLG